MSNKKWYIGQNTNITGPQNMRRKYSYGEVAKKARIYQNSNKMVLAL